MKASRIRIAVVLAAVALPTVAGGAGPSMRPARSFVDRAHGISLRYFDGWHVTNLPLNGIIDPVQRFVLSSYPVRPGSAESVPPAGGVIVQLAENEPPLALSLNRLPARPRRFTIPKPGLLEGFGGDRWGEIILKEHGRAFYLFVDVGARVNPAVRAQLLTTLDTLVIARVNPDPELGEDRTLVDTSCR